MDIKDVTSNWQWYVGAYLGLCLAYVTVGIRLNSTLIKALLKCAPTLFLINICISILQTFGRGPVGHVELSKQFERTLFGLIFSCIGDFYLIFDGFFIHGIASFAFTQAIYVFLFRGHTLISLTPSSAEMVVAVGILIVSLSVYFYLFAKLSRIIAICLGCYCILISTMLWSSLIQMLHSYNGGTLIGVLGASMFYLSDLLLGINRWRKSVLFGPELVMVTYYLAQIFIVWSQVFVVV